MDTMNMRIPPAMKKDPGWMPRNRRIALPVNMNTHSTTKATAIDLSMVACLRPGGRDEVREMKTGTIPKGSTTMNTARNIVKISLAMADDSIMGRRRRKASLGSLWSGGPVAFAPAPLPSEGAPDEPAPDHGGTDLRVSYLLRID